MNSENKNTENSEGWQSQGESLNTGSAESASASSGDDREADKQGSEPRHGKDSIHNNALYAASMGSAATAAVDPHNNSGLAQTGTNTSYEGPTAPGAGGSVGSGYASGQSAADTSIATDSDEDQAGV